MMFYILNDNYYVIFYIMGVMVTPIILNDNNYCNFYYSMGVNGYILSMI